MINFKPNKMTNSWGKGFLTSVLGTTISILLTFGTSALIESKEKADIQRQTAMMVIHDIDVCVEQMEEMAKDEEEMNNAMQYILAHLDQIASLPKDTIELAMDMLIDYDPDRAIFDDAKENILTTWPSLIIWRDSIVKEGKLRPIWRITRFLPSLSPLMNFVRSESTLRQKPTKLTSLPS